MSKLPNATFDDATDVVGLVRYVKSDEETVFLRRSAAVAAAGLDALINLARPGVDAGVLYADVTARLLELRSEYYPLALTLDPIGTLKPKRYMNPPIGKRLASNTVDHQRSERDPGRAIDPGLPAGSARQNSRRVETGDRVTEGSLRSRFEIDQTRNHTWRSPEICEKLRPEARDENRHPDAGLRLW